MRLAGTAAGVAMLSVGIFWLASGNAAAMPDLREMQDAVARAGSVRYRKTHKFVQLAPNGRLMSVGPERAFTVYADESLNRIRTELDGGMYRIYDGNSKTMLIVAPTRREASITTPTATEPSRAFNMVSFLRTLGETDAASLGTMPIGNHQAVGFRVSLPSDDSPKGQALTADVWVDAETQLPVRVEIKKGGIAETVMTDFDWKIDLDDEFFSMEPPAGFKVHMATPGSSAQVTPPPAGQANERGGGITPPPAARGDEKGSGAILPPID